ncbi:MAG: single-stranded DNA-binding protein [Bacteroidales bacterium]|nr:single-stranded DNA-binding protein [Bacteroidales bacterium]
MLLYNRTGVAIICGTVGRDPQTSQRGDKTVTEFYLNYAPPVKNDDGSTDYKSMWVKVWNADKGHGLLSTKFLEKGDKVLVIGTCNKNEYMSNKKGRDTYEIVAEMVIPAALIDTMMTSLGLGNTANEDVSTTTFRELSDNDGELPF